MSGFWTRRQFVVAGAASFIVPAGMIDAPPAWSQARKITVMALGGSWGDAIRDLIGKPFAARENAEIAYDQRPNAQQLAALEASRGAPTVDLVELGGSRLGQAMASGLIDPIDPARVPNFADVLPHYRNAFYADRYIAPWGLTVNTRRVPKEKAEAEGWQVLLDRKLKGMVAIPKFGWMGEMWMNALNQTLGGTYDNLDPAVEFCRKVVRDNDGLVMESNDQGMKLFSSGEIAAAPFWSGRTYQLQESKVPVEYVATRGWVAYGGGFVLVRGSPQRELAEKFLDVSLSPEAGVEFAKRFAYLPTTAKGIAAVAGLPKLQIAPSEMERSVSLEYDKIYKFSDRNLERFNKEVVG